MTMPMMTHRHGACIGDEVDLHLGQKPKLGGGTPTVHSSTYHILSVPCISMFRFLYCSHSYFCIPKHKKTKNISVVSLCLPFQLLALVCFTCYFWFNI
jgi:hypothetical protein